MTKKITKEELESLIMEELDNLDEGLWSTLKGYASGAANWLSGFGYKRGKAASALLSFSKRLEDSRWEFIDDIEGLFMPMGSDVIQIPPPLKDLGEAWNTALEDVEKASDTLKKLAAEVRSAKGPTSQRRAPGWDRPSEEPNAPTPTPPSGTPSPSPSPSGDEETNERT